jgi:hypothetical protein
MIFYFSCLRLVPMNRKLLGVSLAAVFAVSMFGISYAASSWVGYSEGAQTATEGNNKTVLTLTASDTVPRQTSELAGFAWFYDGADLTDNEIDALAMTIHSGATGLDTDPYNEIRDSTQNPNNWHLHNVVLKVPTEAGNAHVCVADLSDAPTGGISIDEDTDLVQVNIRNSALADTLSSVPGAAAYSIVVADNCPPTIGTEAYGDANTPVGPVPLGLVVAQITS